MANKQPTTTPTERLDRPIWGVKEIGREAGLFKEDGEVNLRRTYYLLQNKRLGASKIGRIWTATPRRIQDAIAQGCPIVPSQDDAERPHKVKRRPVDRCRTRVRSTVREIMRKLTTATEYEELFFALRDEIADLEKVAEKRQQPAEKTEQAAVAGDLA